MSTHRAILKITEHDRENIAESENSPNDLFTVEILKKQRKLSEKAETKELKKSQNSARKTIFKLTNE